ncbi:MAG TPA: hypothetical protein VM687_10075 [Stenotrophomonas sp.]|nr:hypothetical protein [Stenotrophomonas sp.]
MSATDPRAAAPANEPGAAALAERRRRARRTAWVVATVALLVYAGFILTGVLGR